MDIEIRKPELERMGREEIQNGSLDIVDDLLTEAIRALRLQRQTAIFANQAAASQRSQAPGATSRKSLVQLFAESPFRGIDLQFQRDEDTGRPATL